MKFSKNFVKERGRKYSVVEESLYNLYISLSIQPPILEDNVSAKSNQSQSTLPES